MKPPKVSDNVILVSAVVSIVISFAMFLLFTVVVDKDEDDGPAVSSRDRQMFDGSWERMAVQDRENACFLRGSLTDEQYEDIMRQLGDHRVSYEMWVDGVDRNC